MTNDNSATRLAEELERTAKDRVLVVTGAGISVASGISTFRGSDPGAVWKQSDVSMATVETFRNDPVGQWRWYLERFQSVDSARPNDAHLALVELERHLLTTGGEFRLITQNIDTLHERAGSQNLIKVHGTSDRLRCARGGCDNGAPRGSIAREDVDLGPFVEAPALETLPRCTRCGELLRAHVLFFDEYYQEHSDYRFGDVQRWAAEAALVLFVGTSFSVGVTDLIVQAALQRSRPIFSIDPHAPTLPSWMDVDQLHEPAEELLPRTVSLLSRA